MKAILFVCLLCPVARGQTADDAVAGFRKQAVGQRAAQASPPSDAVMGDAELAQVKSEWVAALHAMASTAEDARYLDERRLPIVIEFSDDRPSLIPSALAEYSGGTLYVNALPLEMIRWDLQSQGVPESRMPRVIARKTAHILAHEIRHAITAAETRKATGGDFPVALIENEMLSFSDQVAAQNEEARLWPDEARYQLAGYEKREAELAQAWAGGGLDEAQKMVCGVYGKRAASILASTNEELAARYVAGARKISAEREDGTAVERRAFREGLAKARRAADFVSDPSRLDRLRAYYALRYQALGSTARAGCAVPDVP